ncbi:hypothetical protein HDU93_003896 [Gonapodya sp. JEL0774]|nr:hypothetical protein HDU93_003896 [Gonapodya sp. JEL0774]
MIPYSSPLPIPPAPKFSKKVSRRNPIVQPQTPFRAAEKHYKRRDRPVDLSEVLDIRDPDRWKGRLVEIEVPGATQRVERDPNLPVSMSTERNEDKSGDAVMATANAPSAPPEPTPTTPLPPYADLRLASPYFGWLDTSSADPSSTELAGPPPRAFTLPEIPGLVLIQSPFHWKAERQVIKNALREWSGEPNVTNLDTHFLIPATARHHCSPDQLGGGLWHLHEKVTRGDLPADFTVPVNTGSTYGVGNSGAHGQKDRDGDGDVDADADAADGNHHGPTCSQPLTASISCSTLPDDRLAPPILSSYLSHPNPPSTPPTTLKPLRPLTLLHSRLRWTSLGLYYDWTTKTYLGMPSSPPETDIETGETPSPLVYTHHVPPVPPEIAAMARAVVGLPGVRDIALSRSRTAGGNRNGGRDQEGDYETYKPQAGIVNFYGLKDTLMAHQDRSEVEWGRRALVSFSFGSTGIFLIGSSTRDVKPVAVYLRSGDIVVMAGESRRAFHGLPRILPSSLPDHFLRDPPTFPDRDADWDLFADFMVNETDAEKNGGTGRRVNVNTGATLLYQSGLRTEGTDQQDERKSPIENLPTETLQRIFRFLPPRTFYEAIPLISRRFRDVSWDAIPGCPGRAIGVDLRIEIQLEKNARESIWADSWSDVPTQYEVGDLLGHPGMLWMCLAALLELSVESLLVLEPTQWELGQHGAPALLDRFWHEHAEEDDRGLPPLKRMKFSVSHISYWSPELAPLDNELLTFQRVLEFVRNGVRSIKLRWPGVDFLGRLPANFEVIDCVHQLEACASEQEGDARKLQTASTLLRLFPSARTLLGNAFCSLRFDAHDSSRFISLVAEERCSLVTKLHVRGAPVSLIAAPRVFTNVHTLGSIKLDTGIKSLLFPSSPGSCLVQKLFLSADSNDLVSLQHEEIVSFTKLLIQYIPHLRYVSVRISTGSLQSYPKLGILLDTLIQLLSPLECEIQIFTKYHFEVQPQSFWAAVSAHLFEPWPSALCDWKGQGTATIRGGKDPNSPIETLPTEILQRIFRFLPPRTFYEAIPSISRRFRDVSWDAIPGCSGRAIGVDLRIEVQLEESPNGPIWVDSWSDVPTQYEAGDLLGHPGMLWMCLGALLEMSVESLLVLESTQWELGQHGAPALLDRFWHEHVEEDDRGLPPLKRMKFTVSHMSWSIDYWSTPELAPLDTVILTFHRVLEFVRNGVRSMKLRWPGVDFLRRLPANFQVLDCVHQLEASASEQEDDARKFQTAATFLRIFPLARTLLGNAFCSLRFDAHDSSRLINLVSEERCSFVTKLHAWAAPVSLIAAPSLFNNVHTLGSIKLDTGIKTVLFPSAPGSSLVQKLFLSADSSELLSLQHEEIVSFTKLLIQYMPHLRYVSVRIAANSSSQSYTKLGTFLDTLIQLLSPLECVIQITSMYHVEVPQIFWAAVSAHSFEPWPITLDDWNGQGAVTIRGGKLVKVGDRTLQID